MALEIIRQAARKLHRHTQHLILKNIPADG
ncbi:hypothetical protein DT23_08635 [Thioclava indica]|uniref:Uncharacterized protein n=1 Tax=Thioclava indica TaxID=1353528 RepID=A0A074J9R4_9RHOB|nr:hypothetical protein DT23_08635 [Thioclava indica]